jgi:hypothetical protein
MIDLIMNVAFLVFMDTLMPLHSQHLGYMHFNIEGKKQQVL